MFRSFHLCLYHLCVPKGSKKERKKRFAVTLDFSPCLNPKTPLAYRAPQAAAGVKKTGGRAAGLSGLHTDISAVAPGMYCITVIGQKHVLHLQNHAPRAGTKAPADLLSIKR